MMGGKGGMGLNHLAAEVAVERCIHSVFADVVLDIQKHNLSAQ